MNAKAGKLVVGLKSGMQIPREMTLEPVIYNYGTWETILTYFGPALENLLNRNACSLYQTGTLSVDGLPQLQNCVRRKKYTAVFDISAKKHKFPADIFEIVTSYDGIQCNEDGSCQIHTDNVGKLPELFVKLQKLEFRLAPQDYVSCPLDQYQQKRHEMCEVMISSFPSADCGSENGSESDVLLFGSSLLKSHQILMNNDPCEISNQSDQFYAMYNCNNSAISNLHRRGLFNSWNWFRCSAIAIYCIDCNWSYGWKWVGWT
ncbi:hypothetical protein HK098_001181 [Nowakowskiella sp. JEL0407]|nr:hypothetical protein HK098_001181 [Nowakowskiella sp. JEL0407]